MRFAAAVTLVLLALTSPLFAAPLHLAGSLTLGDPMRQDDGRYRLPVIMTTDAGSVAPQAFCFRLNFSLAVVSAAVEHGGVTYRRPATFEWQNATSGSLSYLVLYDPAALSMPVGASIIVADIVVAAPEAVEPIAVTFDSSSVTMISDQAGTVSATQALGTLALAGTTITPTSWYPAPSPVPPPAAAEPPQTSQRRRSSGH